MGETGLSTEELEAILAHMIAKHTEPWWSVILAWSIIGIGCLCMAGMALKALGVW